MARIRSIKPEFFASEDVAALPMRARLTWIGLWVHCDNYGRTKDNLKLVKSNVWPLDSVGLRDVEEDLSTLAENGRIVRYQVDGRGYLAVVNWDLHQTIARPGKPKYPAPPPDVEGVSRHDSDTTVTGTAHVNGEQGTGNREQGWDARERASPPPRRCPKHEKHPDPPNCVKCKDARLAADAWKPPARPPHCGECDPENRMLGDHPPLTRCPRCHPGATHA